MLNVHGIFTLLGGVKHQTTNLSQPINIDNHPSCNHCNNHPIIIIIIVIIIFFFFLILQLQSFN
jgi:hypothetical protein